MFGEINFKIILSKLIDKGFNFHNSFMNLSAGDIYLRHDIDFSLEDGLKIAKLENELNIKANFFFMLTSEMYNPLSKNSSLIIDKIRDMGHSISLHFDPTVYENLDMGFKKEREIFETHFKTSLEIISIHRPRDFLLNNNR